MHFGSAWENTCISCGIIMHTVVVLETIGVRIPKWGWTHKWVLESPFHPVAWPHGTELGLKMPQKSKIVERFRVLTHKRLKWLHTIHSAYTVHLVFFQKWGTPGLSRCAPVCSNFVLCFPRKKDRICPIVWTRVQRTAVTKVDGVDEARAAPWWIVVAPVSGRRVVGRQRW